LAAITAVFFLIGAFLIIRPALKGDSGGESSPERPAVILDTHDPIDDPPPGILHTVLPGKEKFRHRYSGLRLLVESDHHLFMVPARWSSKTSRTLVIDNSADIRLQLIPKP
jgi:hypothetical protein